MSCWLTASQSNKTGVITASEPILKAADDVQAARGGNNNKKKKNVVCSRTESPSTLAVAGVFGVH